MKSALAIAAISTICAAGHAFSPTVNIPTPQQGPSFAFMLLAADNDDSVWNGRWQGTTESGFQLVLQLKLQGQRIGGRLTVGKQSANIIYGKVVGDAFALTTGPIDGRGVDATGRHVGDAIELTIDGVKQPLTLTRVK
jgi:hypothetical protein